MKRQYLLYSLLFVFTLALKSAAGQNRIRLLRYEDDFSLLKGDSLKRGPDRLKSISLADRNYISFGGELREQLQLFNNINFGDVPATYQNTAASQLNHRLLLHSNIEIGSHLRFFFQLNNTLRFLNDNPIIPEIDENQLSLHQAFAEVKLQNWDFRVGRQELFYGNHRLITVREGPNTRKTFDGIVARRSFKNGSIDFLLISPVVSRQNIFDDESFKESLIGIYGTRYFSNRKIGVDYYVVNFQSGLRKYNYQPGFENRQTYGGRLFSKFNKINFEVEGAYQSGTFDNLTISAYSILTDISCIVAPKRKGIVGLAFNAASGDRDEHDNKLNTYNLLFAKPAYGLAIPVGSTNIISFSPYIKIDPIKKLNVLVQAFLLARNSSHDGTYSPSMQENRPTPASLFSSDKKMLGQFYILESNYQHTRRLSFAFDASYFKAGDYPKATGSGKDVTYFSIKSTYRF